MRGAEKPAARTGNNDTRRCLCLVAAIQIVASPALADPYPFDGFFAMTGKGVVEVGCGFDILHQTSQGAFSAYLLDRDHWRAHGKPKFVRYKHGMCTFDAATRIDNCVTHENHVSGVPAKPDRAQVTVLDQDNVAMLSLGEEQPEDLEGVPPFIFQRCPFTAEQVAPLLSDSAASYSKEALRDMARADEKALRLEVVRTIQAGGAKAD